MCLAKAYIDRNGKRELVMEEVASLEIGEGKLLLKTIFGEQKEIEANLSEISFMNNVIVMVNPES